MPDPSLQRRREELARVDVGQTTVRPWLAWILVLQFVPVIYAVPIIQALHDSPGSQSGMDARRGRVARLFMPPRQPVEPESGLVARVLHRNRALLSEMNRLEDDLEDRSLIAQLLRPPAQYLLAGHLGAGNEQAYPGRSSWLFYRQDLDYLTSARPWDKARQAILHVKAQLDARGIQFILMPTPVKPTVHPEQFSRHFDGWPGGPLQPASYSTLIEALERDGTLVFDPAKLLVQAKQETGTPQYLMTDTHWQPDAVQLTAERLRDFIAQHLELPLVPSPDYTGHPVEVANLGDIARLLDLPQWQMLYHEERVSVRQIRTRQQASWRHTPSADVLVLGDSFSNIYSLAAMGWGESAGFVEQLSFLLQRPLDRIIRNDNGAFATREVLARELAGGNDRLAGKRLVILQFASRELAAGNWKLIDFTLGESKPRRFFVPEPAQLVVVRGTIQEIAPVPRPRSVPYADHITALHLVDLTSEQQDVAGGQALVYTWGMRSHVWEPAARLQAGDIITVCLRPWTDVAGDYEGINRSELDTDLVQFEPPTWGTFVDESAP